MMALFTSAESALLTGFDILKSMDDLNEKRQKKSLESVHIGIAINAGPVMLGPVGDTKRMAATGETLGSFKSILNLYSDWKYCECC